MYIPQKSKAEINIYENTKVFSIVLHFPLLKPRLHGFRATISPNKAPKSPIPKTPMLTPPTKTTMAIERENS